MQVDAIEQRTRQPGTVARDLVASAAATGRAVTQVATGTGIHGGNQLEAGGKAHLVGGTGNHDMAGLQRLPQYFQHLAVKLW